MPLLLEFTLEFCSGVGAQKFRMMPLSDVGEKSDKRPGSKLMLSNEQTTTNKLLLRSLIQDNSGQPETFTIHATRGVILGGRGTRPPEFAE